MKVSKRLLEPEERIAEVLFGLIMVLTFTGTLSVAGAGRPEIRTMLVGALGCNLAWGIIDGVLYLMGCLAERNRGILTLKALRKTTDPDEASRIIAEALPFAMASVLQPAELESLRQRLVALPAPPDRAPLTRSDWMGALSVFLWVFLATFPVAIPFLLLPQAGPALRVSNAIAIAMLFALGAVFGRIVGRSPWAVGLSMVFLGSLLVALTIALGG